MATQHNTPNHKVMELYPSTQHRNAFAPSWQIREPGGIYDLKGEGDDGDESTTLPLVEQTEEPLSITLLEFYDDLYGVFSANEFYYQALEAIAADCQLDISSEAKFGLMRNARWLKRQQNAILERLTHIRKAVQATEK